MEESIEPVVLTQQEWSIAQSLARDLARDVDRNELGKALAYFQRTRSKERFFELLDRLPRSGYVRSNRTGEYLKRIAEACRRHLQPIGDDRRALTVVGWSFRLMTHYQTVSDRRSPDKRPAPRRR